MSYYHVPTPARRRVAWRLIGALVGGSLLVALAAGWSAARPVSATVDGTRVRLMAGDTVSDLQQRRMLRADAGDLLSVSGSVVETDGGQPPRVVRNGRYASPGQRIYDGDVLVSSRGSNVTESLLVTETAVPFGTRFEGKGPIVELRQLGSPGLIRRTIGERSGEEVTRSVEATPVDTVFVRVAPRPGTKLVALTFDDGPSRGQTSRVLDILAEHEVKATFFLVGQQVRAQPGLARRIVREGHQVANHTYAHRRLSALDRKQVRREVLQGRNAIRDVTGVRTAWFRPPYGAVDREAWDELEHIDQRVVLWDVDPRDWARPGTGRIVDDVVSNVKPGSVVLLHDGGVDRRQTMAALPVIISRLKAKGYLFVTVEELSAAK